ncbi:hypothetical protein ACIGXM_01235 [Kitasatospora sp. NPDC052896]|uniref:hypothetical protein n=1 Tax=Kitasatospora sp. NPDC052896 TaxID=3364061 RepID=UPI0037C5E90E
MLARPFARRSRLLAATALVLATGTAALAPATAFAATPAPGAPAQSDAKPLVAQLSAPSSVTPLTRGGSTEALTLTVTNNSDQAQPFNPSVAATPVGSPASGLDWINFDAKAISAPATWAQSNWRNDGFHGYVVPDHHMTSSPFMVPAHETYSWSVSFGVTAALPSDDIALKLSLANDVDDSTNGDPVTLPIAAPAGALVQSFSNFSGTVSYQKPFETDLILTNNGSDIDSAINPTLRFGATQPVQATFGLEVWQDDRWVSVPGSGALWQLPPVTAGLAKGASHQYKLRLSLTSFTGPGTTLLDWLSLTPDTNQGSVDVDAKALLTVNGTPLSPSSGDQTGQPGPTSPTSPTTTTGKPVAPVSDTSATTPAPVAASGPTQTSAAPVVPASDSPSAPTTTTLASDTTTPAAANLAYTGAGDTPALLGVGGALVVLGAGAVLYAQRRRAKAQG